MREVSPLLAGTATGDLVVLDEPLSFWGGIDSSSGTVIDKRHPQLGVTIAGKVLVLPHGKGSSSASSVLAECLRLGTGPAAIVLDGSDEILLAGALVAEELYGVTCPVVVADIDGLETGQRCRLTAEALTLID